MAPCVLDPAADVGPAVSRVPSAVAITRPPAELRKLNLNSIQLNSIPTWSNRDGGAPRAIAALLIAVELFRVCLTWSRGFSCVAANDMQMSWLICIIGRRGQVSPPGGWWRHRSSCHFCQPVCKQLVQVSHLHTLLCGNYVDWFNFDWIMSVMNWSRLLNCPSCFTGHVSRNSIQSIELN